ncbi:probable sigma factor [Clostridioides difficile]|nr:probable sigma factor [Clostridioides difficile]
MSKTKKEFFNATKKQLSNYKQLSINIIKLKNEIQMLKDNSVGDLMKGISYDSVKTGKTNKTSNMIEDAIVNVSDLITEKEIELYEAEIIKSTIDLAIRNLKPIHKQIITYKYIEGLEWSLIVDKVYLEERQLRERANQAINSISIALFGKKALIEQEPLFELLDYKLS